MLQERTASQIVMLSQQIEETEPYSTYYDYATAHHFWINWRFQVLYSLIHSLNLPQETALKGLDIGCGNGVVRQQIERATRWVVDGTDRSYEALRRNHPGRGRTFWYDIQDRREELKEAYDFILLFDVIEHIEDSASFLEIVLHHLKPSGWLFINVPALNLLFSRYDVVQRHYRRYNRSMMRRTLQAYPVHIQDMRYWGCALLPVALLRKWFIPKQASPQTILRKGFEMPTPWLNTWFLRIMGVETALLKKPFAGTSLMTAAQKLSELGDEPPRSPGLNELSEG